MRSICRSVVTVVLLLAIASSCWSTAKKDAAVVGSDVAACANAEKDTITKGLSVAQAVLDVVELATNLAAGLPSLTTVEGLIATYGEPVVGCTIAKLEAGKLTPATPGVGSGSGSSAPATGFKPPNLATIATKLVAQYHLEKYRPAKS